MVSLFCFVSFLCCFEFTPLPSTEVIVLLLKTGPGSVIKRGKTGRHNHSHTKVWAAATDLYPLSGRIYKTRNEDEEEEKKLSGGGDTVSP